LILPNNAEIGFRRGSLGRIIIIYYFLCGYDTEIHRSMLCRTEDGLTFHTEAYKDGLILDKDGLTLKSIGLTLVTAARINAIQKTD